MTPPETVRLDVDNLTLGEIELVEEMSGLSVALVNDPEKPKGKLLRAIALVVKRREDPSYAWEQTANLLIDDEAEPVDPPVESAS